MSECYTGNEHVTERRERGRKAETVEEITLDSIEKMTEQTENNIKLNMIENTEKSISEHTGRNNQVRFVRKKKNTQN